MTDHEYREFRVRTEVFFPRLKRYLLNEPRTFSGAIASSAEPVPYTRRESLTYQPIHEGLCWGKMWDSAWVRLDGEIPSEWEGKEVAFRINLGGEILIFGADGVPVYSLTNTSTVEKLYKKEYFQYTASAVPGPFQVWMEAAANGLLGEEGMGSTPPERSNFGSVFCIQYGLFNREVWQLMLDFEVAMSLINCNMGAGYFAPPQDFPGSFPRGSAREKQIIAIMKRAVDAFGDDSANATAARQILAGILGQPASPCALVASAVGHAHLDIGWLWPVRENIRKAARTFSSQLTLLDKYPTYVFGASQPQLYQMVKDNYPELYERIRQRVQEGRWELQGGTWVEMDCNIPCGESLVREFLHGKNFYRDEFGIEVRNLWLPDTFGYNGNLPQLMKLCRCDCFVTNKMAWNDTNKLPMHAFNWVGIDGTSVMAFMTPEGNYNAPMTPAVLNYGASRFSCPEILPGFLSLYGIGDGGGGPTEDFVERALRCGNLEGCPKVKLERAQKFLDTLPQYRDQLPSWHGELYLENHRGTLTTHADIKKAHRRCEEMLLQTETLYVLLRSQAPYPREALDRLWKKLMLNQFHDILPGSAIPQVYETARRDFQDIQDECQALCDKLGFPIDTKNVSYFNTLGCGGTFLLDLPPGWTGVQNHECQKTPEGRIFFLSDFAPLDINLIHRDDHGKLLEMTVGSGLDEKGDILLSYDSVTCRFDAVSGRLLAVQDCSETQTAVSFDGNCFALYRDYPTCHDAWNVEPFYKGERLPVEQRLLNHTVRTGPLFSELIMEIALGDLRIHQTVRICQKCRPVYFHTRVEDWRQDHRMLRVSFRRHDLLTPVAICSTPFGAIEQPTHVNTSWEEAKFEVPMQQWVDVSEKNNINGFAILNDCKYGVSVQDGIVDIDLLRAPTYPDPTADRGPQEFTYALIEHTGDSYRDADVINWAKMLNRPPVRLWGSTPSHAWNLPVEFHEIGVNFYVEALKKAEKGEDLIFRVAEQRGQAEMLSFTTEAQVTSITECDMLEWEDLDDLAEFRALIRPNGEADYLIPFRPYQIRTFRMKLKK